MSVKINRATNVKISYFRPRNLYRKRKQSLRWFRKFIRWVVEGRILHLGIQKSNDSFNMFFFSLLSSIDSVLLDQYTLLQILDAHKNKTLLNRSLWHCWIYSKLQSSEKDRPCFSKVKKQLLEVRKKVPLPQWHLVVTSTASGIDIYAIASKMKIRN